MAGRRTGASGRWGVGQPAGLVLLLALVAPLLLPIWLRASSESTLWIDEIHSLQLVHLTVPRLLDETARDLHPPGYPLALKAWLKAGRALGLEPGVPWARALNVGAWGFAVVAAWLTGLRLFGYGGAILLTLSTAGSSAAAVAVRDLRSYGFAFALLTIALLLLTVLRVTGRRGRRETLLWTLYGAALAGALWSHLLAAPAVALLTLSWLVSLRSDPRPVDRRAVAAGTAAHAGAWLLFLPWMARVPAQVGHLRRAAPEWMTPPTLENLGKVIAWWWPYGRISPPGPEAEGWWLALGALAVGLPIAVGLAGRRDAAGEEAAKTMALLALPTAFGSLLVYWLLARLGVAATFHGPRYPVLVGGLLAAGLVGAALHGVRRTRTAVLVLAPWLATSALGHAIALQQESVPGGLTAFRAQVEEVAEAAEVKSLFVTPSELAPFVRETFAGFELRRVEDLVCTAPDHALVLDVNPWRELDRPRDEVVRRSVQRRRLAANVERHDWRDAQTAASLYRLDDLDAEFARELCARGLRPGSPIPAGAVASARPEDQLAADGWSYLELDDDLRGRRWAKVPEPRVRFDRTVPTGEYVLHLAGARLPYPEEVVKLGVFAEGGNLAVEPPLPPGPFELTLPMTLDRPRRPDLRLRHPLWSPSETLGTGDARRLSFLFEGAWLTEAGR